MIVTWRAKIEKDSKNPGLYRYTTKPKYEAPLPRPTGRILIPQVGDCFVAEFEDIPMYFLNKDLKLEKIVDKRTNCPCGRIINSAHNADKHIPGDNRQLH